MQNLSPPTVTASPESPLPRHAVASRQATPCRWNPVYKPPSVGCNLPPPHYYKPSLRVRPVATTWKFEIHFLGLIINIQFLPITLSL